MATDTMCSNRFLNLKEILRRPPEAAARLRGSSEYPRIEGRVYFYQTSCGVVVTAEVIGLPFTSGMCESPIFAFHIHEGDSCSGNSEDPFADVMQHYNPHDCEHPYHAGDLPPFFGNHGHALMTVLTDRFSIEDVIGKTVIIHDMPDDFTTQPSGNAGMKIACGDIQTLVP